MPALFDKLSKLSTGDLLTVEALAAGAIKKSGEPLGIVETFAQYLGRPKRFLAAYDLLFTSAMVRTCRDIETVTFTPSAEASARFRKAVMQSLEEWQRSAPAGKNGGRRHRIAR